MTYSKLIAVARATPSATKEDRMKPTRGRPPSITREKIAEAGIALGLPGLTVVGVAAQLGVSHMGLYKHISGLDELRRLVAETIFLRWQFPPPSEAGPVPADHYLLRFAESMWQLVAGNPGLAPYLLRGDLITPAMTESIVAHQIGMSQACRITFAQSRWLLLTIAFHVVAVADTLQPQPAPAEGDSPIDRYHRDGIRALILGCVALLPEIAQFPYPVAATAGLETPPKPQGSDTLQL